MFRFIFNKRKRREQQELILQQQNLIAPQQAVIDQLQKDVIQLKSINAPQKHFVKNIIEEFKGIISDSAPTW